LQPSGALVAIKSVNLSKLNKKLKDNLYSEIEILKGLQHPHIVALIDCRESTTHIHLVMEFCQLGDLSYFIKKRERLATNIATADMARKYPNPAAGGLHEVVARHFLKQIASALESLRALNLIHRDVKPQNLLISPSPQFLATWKDAPKIMSGNEDVSEDRRTRPVGVPSLPMLKIADFGFARSLPSTSLAETLCGSPLYMAPEILRYEKYDAKADLWSVGTVLYEMMTGKPPFRAGNHVELLRKIDFGNDIIKFPKESIVSPGMKSIIRGLLKRSSVERISFENFFGHEVIQEPIPGLVGEDRPREARPVSRSEESQPISRQLSNRDPRRGASDRDSNTAEASPYSSSPRDRIPKGSPTTARDYGHPMSRVPSGTPPRPPPERIHTDSNPIRPEAHPIRRPGIQSAATAPARGGIHGDRTATANPATAVRSPIQPSPSPESSLLSEQKLPKQETQLTKEEKERAAQDVAFERDYVVVEKQQVLVNAFADELAANSKLGGPQRDSPPVPTVGAVNTSASPNVQVVPSKRPDHHRQNSYERRYGQSPNTTTSAISKAIQGASLRLFGIGYTPQLLGKGQSPPQFYSPFPAYPASGSISGLIGDSKLSGVIDEDAKTVHIIEEAATVSDVVYGFAEVKYKQLIPLAPSMDHGLGGPVTSEKAESGPGEEDEGLTADAVVVLSEEALVLYVKALALLAKSMDIASAWWAKKNRGEVINVNNSSQGESTSSAAAGNRINQAVQWVRGRFNEVLEKAEFVRLKLLEAQKQLPEDHLGHPNNRDTASKIAGASTSSDGVVLCSGVTAEKLMYDRALEMSRAAAINEIANVDLPGCELSYVTAVRMLEAVLENDDLTPLRKPSNPQEEIENKLDDTSVNGINLDDRQAVQKGMSIEPGVLEFYH
jgi:serine/threonine-protein kinase ULK2